MKARTKSGQQVNEAVQGFKEFLHLTMKDRLSSTQSPQSAKNKASGVELYEKYLPYAIALGLENEWTKNLNDVYAGYIADQTDLPFSEVLYLAESISALFAE